MTMSIYGYLYVTIDVQLKGQFALSPAALLGEKRKLFVQ